MTPWSEALVDVLNAASSAGITWWVSATVLCAAILGAVWTKRQELTEMSIPALRTLGGLVTFFLISIIGFGVAMVWYTWELGSELQRSCALVVELGHCTVSGMAKVKWAHVVGFTIGTSSFVVYTIGWFILWSSIRSSLSTAKTRAKPDIKDENVPADEVKPDIDT